MATEYYNKYLKYKFKYNQLKNQQGGYKFGKDLLINDPIVINYFRKYGIPEDIITNLITIGTIDTTKHKIIIDKAIYNNFDDIPKDEFCNHQSIPGPYNYESLVLNDESKAFVIWRLIDKYNTSDEQIKISTENEIDKLCSNDIYMKKFIFLIRQTNVLNFFEKVENEIVNASREISTVPGQLGKPTLDQETRTSNNQFIKMLSKQRENKWQEIIKLTVEILK